MYRLRLLGANGRTIAALRLDADTDKEAVSASRATLRVALNSHPELSSFELWEGQRRVGAEGVTVSAEMPKGSGSPSRQPRVRLTKQ